MQDDHGREWSDERREHLIVLVDPVSEQPYEEAPVGRCESAWEGAQWAQEFVHQEAAGGCEAVVWLVDAAEMEVVGEFRCRRVTGVN